MHGLQRVQEWLERVWRKWYGMVFSKDEFRATAHAHQEGRHDLNGRAPERCTAHALKEAADRRETVVNQVEDAAEEVKEAR